MKEAPRFRRSRRVPEVLQSSLTDCGPAALKAVLEGFGICVDYDALRERCQTDVDGTSIDALAALGCELGLKSQRILVPHDHFLLPEARCLPAIVVTRSGGGLLHFVVVWRALGPLIEILDPVSGRRWVRARRLLSEMPVLPIAISSERFRRWAMSDDARRPWCARLRALGISAQGARELFTLAEQDASFSGFARLDAALRMLTPLVQSGVFGRGREALKVLRLAIPASSNVGIPERFRWVRAAPDSEARLVTHGSVILRFSREPASPPPAAGRSRVSARPSSPVLVSELKRAPVPSQLLPERVSERLAAPSLRPLHVVWSLLRARAGGMLAWLVVALSASACLVPIEALVLRALFDMDRQLVLSYQRLGGLLAVLVVIAAGLLLDLCSGRVLARLGRELETRARAALLERLPRLDDAYLRSRSSSDMASRGHSLHALRALPLLWAQMLRSACTVLALTGTLIWLYPPARLGTLLLAAVSLILPFCARRSLAEKSLRLHTQAAALDRFYLDTLLGVAPVRVHGAERAVQNAHEQLLTEWARTARRLHLDHTAVQGLQLLVATGVVLTLVLWYLSGSAQTSGLLLIAFLAWRLALAANELTAAELAVHDLRTIALRVLAPLAAPVSDPIVLAEPAQLDEPAEPGLEAPPEALAPGAQLVFENVSVVVNGHALLRELSFEVPSGRHVGIVGASGAGKSSLLGLLLGWLRSSEGRLSVDGQTLDARRLGALRLQTAWVDPAIQLWDQSLLANLAYGDDERLQDALPRALRGADLLQVLEQLPQGLQSNLGEGGSRLSGGQGQRVRLGRAWLRERPRLVLLDEPFRGLTRERRRELARRARQHWQAATLLFVSHDVEDTAELDQVLVIDNGRLVERGDPRVLLRDPSSRYAGLTRAARALRGELWQSALWRRLSVLGGRLVASEQQLEARRERSES